jgi:hypothetical protein
MEVLKDKIKRLHYGPNKRLILGAVEQEKQNEEQTTLFHLVKRQQACHVGRVRDGEGNECTSAREMMRTFTEHLRRKVDTIPMDKQAIHDILEGVKLKIATTARTAFQMPITEEELHGAVMNGKKKKAPGYDGICTDFLQVAWPTIREDLLQIVNSMYKDGGIAPTQTKGVIVYVPKSTSSTTLGEYRPLKLLNSDIKLFSRSLLNLMRPWLDDILQPSQHCGVRENNILDAIAAIRETVAVTETTNEPLCILSIDFKEAFNRIAHTYLYSVLECYGFCGCMIGNIRKLYDSATFVALINGNLSQPVKIKSSIRQGCPMSMLLFALCLDPLIRKITEAISGCRPTSHRIKLAVVAYADDVVMRGYLSRNYGNILELF